MERYRLLIISCLFCSFTLLPGFSTAAWSKNFKVVIDPGHGGHDPGAVGKVSKEKDINLNVSLKLGKLIKDKNPDVEVIFTRNKDIFVPLMKRAEIANKSKADLFISIHTNSIAGSKTVKGASTWTLGLAKSEANLEVAKRENSVILYEDDYKTRYAGFDPNSSESYIIFEFIQDKNMAQSVGFASMVQNEFKTRSKRVDKGVHQAGFLVLKETAMPSILIELGFISTPEEERYLNTHTGQQNMANGIYNAFIEYKNAHELRIAQNKTKSTTTPQHSNNNTITTSNNTTTAPTTQKNTPKAEKEPITIIKKKVESQDKPIFKIQIMTSSTPLKENDRRFKGLKNVEYYFENGLYKYTFGATSNYNEIKKTRDQVVSKFSDAFIIAFKNDKKIDVNKAIDEFLKVNRK
ncbi:MAG: N-acetylmuramoyl-L-alanine amidase [Bacteroidales bacterium]|nr:N-acetylmuramoyl-L-alanine amidase [Bacteroidales bacterium]